MRKRAPDDDLPIHHGDVYPEIGGSLRFQLPVAIATVKGCLVIRATPLGVVEMSIRGKAASLLERI
jgi:hypothetical protein